MYADYQFYLQSYLKGQEAVMDPGTFERYEENAARKIRRYTLRKSDAYTAGDEVKIAACAVAEKLHAMDKAYENANGRTGISSERVGEYSVSYSGNTFEDRSIAVKKETQRIMREILEPTGLLYRGLDHVC